VSAGWAMTESGFDHTGPTEGWMRYHHVEPGSWDAAATTPRQPAHIMDHLAYNVTHGQSSRSVAHFWVPDLVLECTTQFNSAQDAVTLELTKGTDRFQAVFAGGKCQLVRINSAAPGKPIVLAEQSTKIASGKHDLRFANVDCRLTVWVDGKPLVFGEAAEYVPSTENLEPTSADLEPARIGATGNISVSKVRLWRDVYYTPKTAVGGAEYAYGLHTFYVQPGHYFCLGDNSSSSADGREWGAVPERLLLGRAVVIYWPLSRIRVIK
jgi:signal peptidase I